MDWVLELEGAQGAAISLAFLCGALLLITLLWNRKPHLNSPASVTAESADMHAALLRLEGELPQLLRSMNGRLDAKMQALRLLIREADSTIVSLRRLQGAGVADSDPSLPILSGIPTSAPASIELLEPATAAPVATSQSAERKRIEPAAPDTADLRLQRYAHVYALADGGLDSAGISGETGMHRGEVELVLNLRRKRVRVDRGSRSEPSPVIRSPEEAPA